ncbi:Mannose-6-phosphate isomerase [Ectocarpus siliculosus]|uniref:mannose-6-phosphate isomerase n=1 Tax=Ectocarpus siliculosus TaxID=2880 RepID=D8LB30_ECTSI|nr:Mannose-6-phosphate isomerase [Ectocarpus siliculosus]|eukprot:CBN76539.1 Mannose-6-phosphate isomerase [Ectocarpus siliculosus]
MARRMSSFIQKYAWGKPGDQSVVASLKAAGDSSYQVDVDQPYAEMWIGTHPSGPSNLLTNSGRVGPLLKDHLASEPEALGDIAHKGDLPFLFKVISINKALSIQAHPNKKLAERLHAERPEVYADDNHKPEMAVTLSDFEALCGFRPFQEIIWNLNFYPELRALVSLDAVHQMMTAGDDIERQKFALRELFRSYNNADKETVKTQIDRLVKRLGWASGIPVVGEQDPGTVETEINGHDAEEGDEEEVQKTQFTEQMFEARFRQGCPTSEALDKRMKDGTPDVVRVMLRLSTEYPGDLGILMPLVLNLLMLKTGQAFFMTVDEPHAYLRGDILECMACSNNVVRCALTPKFRDVDLLVDMLTYNMAAPAVLRPHIIDDNRKRFTPPVDVFEIEMINVPGNDAYRLNPMPVPAVLVTLHGAQGGLLLDEDTGKEIPAAEGGIFFLPANTYCTMVSGKTSDLRIAMAHTNLNWGPMTPSGTGAPNF